MSMVMRQVFEPRLAAAAAASHPAWPAPITITSYLKSIDLFFLFIGYKNTKKFGELNASG
jgi:hypothetical protein